MDFKQYSVPKLGRNKYFDYMQQINGSSSSGTTFYGGTTSSNISTKSLFQFISEDNIGPTLSGYTRTSGIADSGSITTKGNVTAEGMLNVTGKALIGSMIDVTGDATLHSSLEITKDTKVGTDLTVINDTAIGNKLTANFAELSKYLSVGTDLSVSNNASVGNDLMIKRNVSANRLLQGGSILTPGFLYVGEDSYLDGDVDVRSKLSVGEDITTGGAITSSDFSSDIYTGTGYQIDKNGNAEMQSLILREFLEVPELRYNRCTVESGTTWNAPGAGLVYDCNTTSKTIYLKLEKGEVGSFQAGDICMGVWHFTDVSASTFNATDDQAEADADGLTVSGFAKIYFTVSEVSDYTLDGVTYVNGAIKYQTRAEHDSLATDNENYARYNLSPMTGMTIVGYGSFTNTDRQKSAYATRTFKRFLIGINNWDIKEANIAMQLGDCSKLTINGMSMAGYSAYLNNIYMAGTIKQLADDGSGDEVPVISISDDGYWVINGVKTDTKAEAQTPTITISDDGYWVINGVKTSTKAVASSGKSAYELWKANNPDSTLTEEQWLNQLAGNNGESSATVDNDNKIITIPCTYEGKAKAANTVTVTYIVYDGKTDVTSTCSVSSSSSPTGITIDTSTLGKIIVSNSAGASISDGTINVKLTYVDSNKKAVSQTVSVAIVTTKDSKTIKAITEMYILMSSDVAPTDAQKESSATSTRPTWTDGKFIYYGYKFTYDDNTTGWSDPWTKASSGTTNTLLRSRGVWSGDVSDYVYNDSYRDYVMVKNAAVATGYDFYVVKKYGTVVPKGTATSNTTYWTPFSEFEAIATNVLLANQGYIDVLGTGSIFIGQTDEGLSHTSSGTTSTSNGWVLSNGAITHTKTGLSLTADGKLNMPAGSISLTVGSNTYDSLQGAITAASQTGGSSNGVTKQELLDAGLTINSNSVDVTGNKFTIKDQSNNSVLYTDSSGLHVTGEVTATSGSFSGKIRASEGQIAGFKISGDGITNQYNTNDYYNGNKQSSEFSSDAYVIIRNDRQGSFTGIGANVMPASTAIRCNARFENVNTETMLDNIALYVKAGYSGSSSYTWNTNYAIYGGGGHAIFKGAVDGYLAQWFKPVSGNNTIDLRKGNKVYVQWNDSSHKCVFLPTLSMTRDFLGVGSSQPFSTTVKVIALCAGDQGGYEMQICGYNNNSTSCPKIYKGDPGYVKTINVQFADCWEFELCYDGSEYRAFVTNYYNG